jgi:hypothetical protein
MLGWPDPFNVDDKAVRDQDVLLDEHEGDPRVLEGDVWLVKIDKNDCDWHLELSAFGTGPNADRVVVEVSQGAGFEEARGTIAALVGVGDIRDNLCFKFTAPATVRVTGWPFFEGHYWSKKSPHVDARHGSATVKTLWELHSGWKVEVERQGKAQGCR